MNTQAYQHRTTSNIPTTNKTIAKPRNEQKFNIIIIRINHMQRNRETNDNKKKTMEINS